jgi:V/A-type H+-transporting ATPase subunit I
MIFIGGVVVWMGISNGWAGIGAGMFCVVFFTSTRGPLWKRLGFGLKGLARISSAFGDALSYMRLFALGLASASLALTFNELAMQVSGTFKGGGLLFSSLILLIGHGLNLLLAVASGVIHGLRLNFIEFLNWSMPEEGYPFRAFERKEKALWIT